MKVLGKYPAFGQGVILLPHSLSHHWGYTVQQPQVLNLGSDQVQFLPLIYLFELRNLLPPIAPQLIHLLHEDKNSFYLIGAWKY